MRQYKSGTKWCFWRWTITPTDYIRRLHVLKTPWFAICVHWINKPDLEPHMHDHPVSFLSLILRGAYTESRYKKGKWSLQDNRWFNWIRASRDDRHKIVEVKPGTTTLCFMGPKTREWGFHTSNGWVYWKDYNTEKYK